jgi:hypothetical protein
MNGSDCTKPKAGRFPDRHLFAKSKRLSSLIMEGKKRYWLHIVIDRFDETVVGQQLAEVLE